MHYFDAVLRSRRGERRLTVNADDTWASPFLQPVSNAPADAVRAAWAPVLSGQAIPMIGEEVGYGEPRYPC